MDHCPFLVLETSSLRGYFNAFASMPCQTQEWKSVTSSTGETFNKIQPSFSHKERPYAKERCNILSKADVCLSFYHLFSPTHWSRHGCTFVWCNGIFSLVRQALPTDWPYNPDHQRPSLTSYISQNRRYARQGPSFRKNPCISPYRLSIEYFTNDFQ